MVEERLSQFKPVKYFISQKRLSSILKYNPNFQSVQSMIQNLWKERDFHLAFEGNPKPLKKCHDMAEAFLEKGKLCSRSGDYFNALEYYNKALIHAPTSGNCDAPSTSRVLSLAYYARTIILYNYNLYYDCLKDIDRTYKAGYLEKNSRSLTERKNNCENKLQQFTELLRMELNFSNPEYMNNCCQFFLKFEKSPDSLPGRAHERGMMHYFRMCKESFRVPHILNENPNIPGLASAVDIQYIYSTKERVLCTTRDVYPGEILISEKDYATFDLSQKDLRICTHCTERTLLPIPCPNCITVVFCSEACRNTALKEYHDLECNILQDVIDMNIDGLPLVLRIIFKTPFEILSQRFQKYKNELLMKEPELFGYNDKGIYQSNNYRTIFSLPDRFNEREPESLLQFTAYALCILKLIVRDGKYLNFEETLDFNKPLSDKYLLLAEIILRHILSVNSNAVEKCIPSGFLDGSLCLQKSSISVSGILGLMSHSCDPSTCVFHYGRSTICRAIKFIPKGKCLTLCFGSPYTSLPNKVWWRNNYRRKVVGSPCNCEACDGGWRSYRKNSLKLQCPKCNSVLNEDIGCRICQCNVFNIPASFFKDGVLEISTRNLLKYTEGMVCKSKKGIANIDKKYSCLKDIYKELVDTITLLCLYTQKPCFELVNAQSDFLKLLYFSAYHYHTKRVYSKSGETKVDI